MCIFRTAKIAKRLMMHHMQQDDFVHLNAHEDLAQKQNDTKGKPVHQNCGFRKGFDPSRKILSEEDYEKAHEVRRKNFEIKLWQDWLSLSRGSKRKRLLEEQNGKCLHCGLDEWLGKKLVIEIDHIDGNHQNETRENFRGLCPNCHSQTPTWRRKKSSL